MSETVKVNIFHNIGRDSFSGLKPDDLLVWVFTYEVKTAGGHSDMWVILDDAYEMFNVGEGPISQDYRNKRLRSLSVGDVVAIDKQFFSVERIAWKDRQLSELRFVPSDKAESLIRVLYNLEPNEPLSITVPLAD